MSTTAVIDLKESLSAQQNGDLIVTDEDGGATYIGRVDSEGDIRLVPGSLSVTDEQVRDALHYQMWEGSEWAPPEWPSEYVSAVGAENLPNEFRIARVAHWGTSDPAYGEEPGRVIGVATLGVLRERWPGWQDAGQTGDDPGLTDETVIYARLDGSVGIQGGGVLCEGMGDPAHWDEGQAWAQLLADLAEEGA